ncbi:MAG: hypothetical protein C5B51_07590 [Terriglobia bacterium]|nr:MAG: hypothetical protein C5B51_07590 [Terriglobia bacterium]
MKKVPALAIFFTLASAAFAQNLKVVNAASLSAVSVAPNSIISIMGNQLSSSAETAQNPASPPTTLGGVTVTIGGSPASLFYVSPTQINALVNPATPLGTQNVVITSSRGTQTGTASVSTTAPPGLFSLSGSGMRNGAIVDAQTFTTGVFGLAPDNSATFLALFGTGISVTTAPTVTIGGVPAPVLFYGPAPCCAGLEQVNVQLPSTVASAGRVSVALTSNGQVSNTVQVVLKAQSSAQFPSRELASLAYIPGTSLLLSTDEDDDVVRVIDASSKTVKQVITLPEGSGLNGIAVNAAGTLAVVAESDRGKAAVIDLTKFTVTTEIATGAGPVAVAIVGSQAIVVNQESDTVSVIDLGTSTVQKNVPVGHGPEAVAVDATSKTAYVVNEADGTLDVIDLTALAVTKILSIGVSTRGEAIAVATGFAYVTVPSGGPDGMVLMVNLSTGAITSFKANPSQDGGSGALVIYNGRIYLANQTGSTVTAYPLSPASSIPIAQIKVDLGPRALAIDTKDNLLAVSNEGSSTIVLVDLATNQVTAHINAVNTSSTGSDGDQDDHSDRGRSPSLPIVTKISPASAKAGTSVALTITGKNFTGATGVVFVGSAKGSSTSGRGKLSPPQPDTAFTVSNVKVSSDGTQITANVTIASTAQAGAREVRVTTPNGESPTGISGTATFTVTQ